MEGIAAELAALPRPDTAALRRVRRRVSAQIEDMPGREVVDLAVALLETGAPGAHVVAYELVLHHPSALATVRARDLRRLGKTMASWAEVDTFGCYVAGRAWRAGQVDDDVIAGWAHSGDRWWRRAALVSTVPLNVKAQGGTGDAARTIAVCRLLIADRDPMVVKALSWALRALAVRDSAAVQDFLDAHTGELAARVVREVTNKLETGRKGR